MARERPIAVPKSAWQGLALVADHAREIEKIAVAARAIRGLRSLKAATSEIAIASGVDESLVSDLLVQVLALGSLRDLREETSEQTVSGLTAAIETHTPPILNPERLAHWKGISSHLSELISSQHPLSVLQKALSLASDHDRWMQSVKIFTDLRPIYSENRDDVRGAVVTHILKLDYEDSTHGRVQVHIALDMADIRSLRKACDQAARKAKVLADHPALKTIGILTLGEDDDDGK